MCPNVPIVVKNDSFKTNKGAKNKMKEYAKNQS